MKRRRIVPPAHVLALVMLTGFSTKTPARAQQPPAAETSKPFVLHDGSVQVVASRPLADVMRSWDRLFAAGHPGLKLAAAVGDNYSAMSLLTFDRALAAVMGCEYTRIGLGNNLKIAADPIAIRVGHAGLTVASGVPALGIIVNPANPIASLSLAQLARIYTIGAPGGDLTRWDQVGVGGDLAIRPIVLFGPLRSDDLESDDPQAGEFLSVDKFNGAMMNHSYQGLPRYQDVVQRVRQDEAAIGIVALSVPLNGVRVVALRDTGAGAAELPDTKNIAAATYPLDRYLYIYLHVGKTTPVDPLAIEYARTALSEEGQRALEAAGYIPLSTAEVAEERARLMR